MQKNPADVARQVIRRIWKTDPDYYEGLLEKADAYGLSLYEYVKQRVEAKGKQYEKALAE